MRASYVRDQVGGGILGFLGLFGPGVLLIFAFMPFWEGARKHAWVRCMLVGMNAASIGLVFSACVTLFFKYCRNSAEAATMMVAMVLGASSAFATPIGYQTNLMVVGRGGYAFGDFLRLGGGLTLVVGCMVAAMCSMEFDC